MNTFSIRALAGAALFLAASVTPSLAMAPMVVQLAPQNSSGESGTATLTDTPKGLKVVISLKGAPASPQPAHIHKGSCAKLDPQPWYPLQSVVGGKSTTVVPGVTMAKIMGKTAINVHKSAADLATYVACGNVAKSAMSNMSNMKM